MDGRPIVGVINDGGAYIDSNGFDVTIAQALSPISTGIGKLVKQGAGTLTLSAATNPYTGDTQVTGAVR